ncbi:hypothetical protein GCM10007094_00470 [Pseudovibrio japonicus]|uniref:Rhamnan synthesis protein F n=1 Tax=Pseudovibrio japonicus TaxID=366534 RepID=A0ABQ3DVB5_9HYPH|nr:rhamnan synthesis F family protein [Pseudovibrio japonicus]GHB16981.1 hypothetical protein GCM10007094_00470 [Pseudovibrio japonicus]
MTEKTALSKVKREIFRIAIRQPRSVYKRLNITITDSFYSNFEDRLTKMQYGQIAASAKVAVYLVHQPDGIRSHSYHSLRHLISLGYAPVIVINGRHSEGEVQKLLSYGWVVIQRPNYGYDFGGYKSALSFLKNKSDPEYLLLINDSIEFPTTNQTSFIPRMENSNCDFVGIEEYSHVDIHFSGSEDYFRKLMEGKNIDQSNRHICSYLLLIKRRLLHDPVFVKFWDDFIPKSDRIYAISKGEVGLTQAIIKNNITLETLVNRSEYSDYLNGLVDNELVELCSILNTPPPIAEYLKIKSGQYISGNIPREELENLIFQLLLHFHSVHLFPDGLEKHFFIGIRKRKTYTLPDI